MAEYMVLLRGSDPELKRCSRQQAAGLMARYRAWVDDLKERRRYLGGFPCRSGSKLLCGRRDLVVITDSPYSGGREAVSGYFVISAASLAEAIDVAKGCPALAHGETVEVIELGS